MASLLLTNFLLAAPYLALWVIGLILAVLWRKRLTKVAFLLALLGCILHLLHTLTFGIFSSALPMMLMQGNSPMSQVGMISGAVGILGQLMNLIASALLVAAIFAGRKAAVSAQD